MIRLNRVRLRFGFLVIIAGAALCLGAVARTTDAPSICTRLVAQMRRSPATVIQDWRKLEPVDSLGYDHWMPWITVTKFGVSSDSGVFRRVDAEWAARFRGPFGGGLRGRQGVDDRKELKSTRAVRYLRHAPRVVPLRRRALGLRW